MAVLADRPNDPRQEQTLGRRGQQHLQVFDVAGEDSTSAALPSLRGGEFYSDFFDLLHLVFVFIPFAFLLPNRMFDGIDSVVDLFVRVFSGVRHLAFDLRKSFFQLSNPFLQKYMLL